MPSNSLQKLDDGDRTPNLEKAILLCYYRLHEKSYDFSDLKFLLLKRELKRSPIKKKKQLYQKWEIELTSRFRDWEKPFKLYGCSTAFLARTLNKMVNIGQLEKNGYQYTLSAEGYVNATRSNLMFNISAFNKYSLTSVFNGKLNLYGIGSISVEENNDLYNDVSLFWSKIDNLINTFHKVENDIIEINHIQLDIQLKVILRQIKNGSYPKKDKKLALKYLKKRLLETDHKKLKFKWSIENGNERLLYIPKNHLLGHRLSILIYNFEGSIVNYILPKPVVFTYEPRKIDYLQFGDIIEEVRQSI